jgi:[acyl-carrier-protein] S-malonyltransferase
LITFMYIGQGSQPPWVTRDVLDAQPVAQLLDVASHETGKDVARLVGRGGRELAATEIEQPAMVAVCLGITRLLLAAGLRPHVAMGHSLGELTSWAAAGGISDEDAIRIAAVRGRLMAREAARHPGGMARIICDRATCDEAVRIGSGVGSLCVGAHNAEDEWSLSGDEPALAAVIAQFRATRFPVAGAWHSPAMAGAVDEVHTALSALPRRPLEARVLANRDGRVASADEMPDLLTGQLVRPVNWVAVMSTAIELGTTRFVAVGPGKTLRALVHRRLGPSFPVEIIDSLAAVQRAAG